MFEREIVEIEKNLSSCEAQDVTKVSSDWSHAKRVTYLVTP